MEAQTTNVIRQRHNKPELTSQTQPLQHSAVAELLAPPSSMLSHIAVDDIFSKSLHNRITHSPQQEQRRLNSIFDTYPPKRNGLHTLVAKKAASSHNLKAAADSFMSTGNSPQRLSSNMGRAHVKRSAAMRRSVTESSTERHLHKYTSSDSSQEEDEALINASAAEKRKMSRRVYGNGLHQGQRYRSQHGIGGDGYDFAKCAIFGKRSQHISDLIDIAIRIVLVIVFCKLETLTAFKRIIHTEEMWMYKNPRTKDYVSGLTLLLSVILGPFFTTLLLLLLTRDRRDFRAASWTWTLCLCFNGLTTSLLKICVGRPRPDFYYRCFPDGVMHLSHNATGTDNMLELFNCTGSFHDINEGRKSFPSGHSSFAFTGFGFISYYVGAKLHAFNHRGRGETWRLCIALAPLLLAALIAVSRTCDYHHHVEDVIVGAIIGTSVSYFVYRQYYPSLFAPNCHRPYPRCTHVKAISEPLTSRHRKRLLSYRRLATEECGETSLLCEEQAPADSAKGLGKKSLLHEQKTNNKWF